MDRSSTARRLAFPFRIDGRGRAAHASPREATRQQIEQILFTMQGERVNRPGFGTGLIELVFAGNSPEIAGTLEAAVRAALLEHLGHRIAVDTVRARAEDSTLVVDLRYRDLETGRVLTETLRAGP